METFKENPQYIVYGNLALTVGGLGYLYKKTEELNAKFEDLVTKMKIIYTKVLEQEKKSTTHDDILLKVKDDVGNIDKSVKDMGEEELNSIRDDLEEVVAALQQKEISVDLPSQVPKRRKKARRDKDDSDDEKYHRRGGRRDPVDDVISAYRGAQATRN